VGWATCARARVAESGDYRRALISEYADTPRELAADSNRLFKSAELTNAFF